MDLKDLYWGIGLILWVGFVTLYVSKLIASRSNTYIARKSIHILAGGVVALISPFVLSSPLIPLASSYALTLYLVVRGLKGKRYGWFQEEGNYGEIFFTFSYGTLLLVFWTFRPHFWETSYKWLALTPIMFMSFGDGVTGIVRNFVYRRRVKGFWGSMAMLAVCLIIGYSTTGLSGVISAVVATVAEVLPNIDDNLSVPFLSALVLFLAHQAL